ncbi:hypothetical protein GGQ84_001297 [Desulfitispora alkaliphila]|uniref:hypothetical protein n=1 Tax=Desulfitispora alkaliphila TaxID=622674 RepID=UPI003D194992
MNILIFEEHENLHQMLRFLVEGCGYSPIDTYDQEVKIAILDLEWMGREQVEDYISSKFSGIEKFIILTNNQREFLEGTKDKRIKIVLSKPFEVLELSSYLNTIKSQSQIADEVI